MQLRKAVKTIGVIAVIVTLATFFYTFFLSENNVENRKKAKKLAVRAQNHIQKKIQESSNLTKKEYGEIVKKITDFYIDAYDLDAFQAGIFCDEMKSNKKNNVKKRVTRKQVSVKP